MSESTSPLFDDAHAFALLETLLAQLPVGIAYVDTNRQYERVNDRFAALHAPYATDPNFGSITESILSRALSGSGNTTALPWANENRHLSLSCYAVREPAEAIIGAALIVRDVTADASADNERRHQLFMRDVLASVTGGRLRFCVSTSDLPEPLTPRSEARAITRAGGIRELRKEAEAAAQEVAMEETRWFDMETAIGEAAMNALVHAGGGVGSVRWDPQSGLVQVWITDTGNGITMENLPRATLEPGFTTADSMGHGFPMMIQTCDRIYLLTGAGGSTVVLEQGKSAPDPLDALG